MRWNSNLFSMSKKKLFFQLSLIAHNKHRARLHHLNNDGERREINRKLLTIDDIFLRLLISVIYRRPRKLTSISSMRSKQAWMEKIKKCEWIWTTQQRTGTRQSQQRRHGVVRLLETSTFSFMKSAWYESSLTGRTLDKTWACGSIKNSSWCVLKRWSNQLV